MVDGAVIEARDIEAGLSEVVTINEGVNYDPPLGEGFSLIDHIEDIQRRFLLRAMQEAGGKKTAAAALLGYTNYQSLAAQLHRLRVDCG
jgi:transcriptional regulator with GAF, ATPase, and Fis domain